MLTDVKDPQENRDAQGHQGKMAKLDPKEILVCKVHQDHRDFQDLRAHRVKQATLGLQEKEETLDKMEV